MEFCKQCPICKSSDLKVLQQQRFIVQDAFRGEELPSSISDVNERLWIYFHKIRKDLSPSELQATLCLSCGFIFFNPRLTQAEITLKYETINALGFDEKRHSHNKPVKIAERSSRVSSLLEKVIGSTFQDRKLAILDYGGAEGFLLLPFANRGDDCYLIDYLVYPLPHEKIQYLGKDLDDIEDGRQFDIILLLHTLEHVVNPVKLLTDLKKLLKPGGLLYIEVPLGAWLEWEFLREPLTHVNFFSEQSLAEAASQAGLFTTYIETNWQWVTESKNPCINLLCQNEPNNKNIKLMPTTKQMKGLTYLQQALPVNARYFTKLVLKSYLKKFV